jgi:hypothetical protein
MLDGEVDELLDASNDIPVTIDSRDAISIVKIRFCSNPKVRLVSVIEQAIDSIIRHEQLARLGLEALERLVVCFPERVQNMRNWKRWVIRRIVHEEHVERRRELLAFGRVCGDLLQGEYQWVIEEKLIEEIHVGNLEACLLLARILGKGMFHARLLDVFRVKRVFCFLFVFVKLCRNRLKETSLKR